MGIDTDLTGRTAIVTGAASGIGRGIAFELADAGANVTIADIQRRPDPDTTPTHEAIVSAGGDAIFHETDITDPDQVDAVVEATVEAFDGIDILVHNAGVSHDGTIETTTDEEWDAVMDVNLKAIFRLSKVAMEYLRDSEAPRIVVVASQLGLVAQPRRPAYVASKGGAIALVRQIAVDYADVPIPVNAVCPGVVRTPMTDSLLDDEERRSLLEHETLLPYFGEPKDVGMMVTYLSSDAARFITGQAFVVDGGYTAH